MKKHGPPNPPSPAPPRPVPPQNFCDVKIFYVVINGEYLDELQKIVNEYLQKGFELQGGVSVIADRYGDGSGFYQAMILKS